MTDQTEWGVRCQHGVARMPDESAARARVETSACRDTVVVRREVTEWVPSEVEAEVSS